MAYLVPLWLPLNPGEVDTVDMVDTEVTVEDMEDTVDTVMVDTVARDLLMLDMAMADMVDTAVDTEDTVDTEVDTEDTVDTAAREKLKPKPGAPLDTDMVPDMVLEDMEVTVLALPAM